jgi:hypothetical protein
MTRRRCTRGEMLRPPRQRASGEACRSRLFDGTGRLPCTRWFTVARNERPVFSPPSRGLGHLPPRPINPLDRRAEWGGGWAAGALRWNLRLPWTSDDHPPCAGDSALGAPSRGPRTSNPFRPQGFFLPNQCPELGIPLRSALCPANFSPALRSRIVQQDTRARTPRSRPSHALRPALRGQGCTTT